MTSTPSLPAQIATLLRITARLEAGGVVMAYPEELPSLNAVLVTLQQHERLEAALRKIAALEGEADYTFARITLGIVEDALAALDTAAPPESLSRSDHIERLEAVVKAARDLLRHAGIKHPGADNVIVSRERVRTLENALAALGTAAPDKPEDAERGLRRDG